jgi:hypothetical protein
MLTDILAALYVDCEELTSDVIAEAQDRVLDELLGETDEQIHRNSRCLSALPILLP